MNLQEALEALLDKRREFEGCTYAQVVDRIKEDYAELLDTPDDLDDRAGDLVASLIGLGGAALALLATDYEPVVGRSLDEWLAETPAGSFMMSNGVDYVIAGGQMVRRPEPTPVNGVVGPVRGGGTSTGTVGSC